MLPYRAILLPTRADTHECLLAKDGQLEVP